jgi:hypothetical protein
VIAGRADGSFSPQAGVSREQMALFLARSLDWLTEDKGASLARIDVSNPVEGPSLVSAAAGPTAPPSAEGTATVAFTFDEEVAATIRPGDLALISFEASTTPASAASRDATNGAVVQATFPASALRLATTATVARGAVRDAGGNPSPEGAAPLQGIALLPGTTTGPDLFSLGRLGASTVDFNFDEAAFVVDPRGYHLVLSDGTTLDSTGAVGDGTTSHNVTFRTLTTAQSSQIVRGYVEPRRSATPSRPPKASEATPTRSRPSP